MITEKLDTVLGNHSLLLSKGNFLTLTTVMTHSYTNKVPEILLVLQPTNLVELLLETAVIKLKHH